MGQGRCWTTRSAQGRERTSLTRFGVTKGKESSLVNRSVEDHLLKWAKVGTRPLVEGQGRWKSTLTRCGVSKGEENSLTKLGGRCTSTGQGWQRTLTKDLGQCPVHWVHRYRCTKSPKSIIEPVERLESAADSMGDGRQAHGKGRAVSPPPGSKPTRKGGRFPHHRAASPGKEERKGGRFPHHRAASPGKSEGERPEYPERGAGVEDKKGL